MRKLIHAWIPVVFAAAAFGGDGWTAYTSIGEGVSVSFTAVTKTTYTWAFRNDGTTTITGMKFSYSYIDADSGQYKTDTDILVLSLKAGRSFGGWAAYTAVTRSAPTIKILEIKRQ